jgi:hypothetical protein
VHALIGFVRLAWLRGDRDHAVELLGERARQEQQFAHAEELLRGSVEAAEPAGEGTVVVDPLEAPAAFRSAEHP